MPINGKKKGARVELRSRDWLEKRGYRVTKSGGSLGCWDLIGIGIHDVVLVQVKANRSPGPVERKKLAEFKVPMLDRIELTFDKLAYPPIPPLFLGHGVRKLIHVWKDYAREPIEMEV